MHHTILIRGLYFCAMAASLSKERLNAAFKIYHAAPQVDGIGERPDYKMTMSTFIGDRHLAKHWIDGEVLAYEEIEPDVVLFGFSTGWIDLSDDAKETSQDSLRPCTLYNRELPLYYS